MPIFDQGYQHWRGTVGRRTPGWGAITWQGVKVQIQSRWVKILLAMSVAPSLALAAFLIFWGLVEQQSSFIQPLLGLLQGLPEEVRSGPKGYRFMIWTLAFNFFIMFQLFFSMMLVLVVGPDLISKDLRFNALPLYLSRPLRRLDYFLGKLGVIGFYLVLVTAAPIAIAYVLGVAFSMDVTVLADTWRIAAGAMLWSLVVIVSAGTLMLAISSLSRNSRYVSIIFVVWWFVLSTASTSVWSAMPRGPDQARPDWPRVISYTNNLWRIGEVCIGTEAAWAQWDQLLQSAQKTAAAGAAMATGMGGRGGPVRIGGVVTGNSGSSRPRPRPVREDDEASAAREADQRGSLRQTFPWQWSAAVLAGVFLLSVLILTTRVRSLDRLK
ncbi:MAG TPA: hypothetical protein PKD86_15620 [Gemmatales bacterium]|nr:hypothetical protein [Gemmatales bacterium]